MKRTEPQRLSAVIDRIIEVQDMSPRMAERRAPLAEYAPRSAAAAAYAALWAEIGEAVGG